MMRSLWTAASGMIAQQNNVDTIANNLANVNTTGYKTETAEFKSLLYQEIVSKTTTANGENKPIGAQVGLGVRNSSVTSHYTQGAFEGTERALDFAIEGDGFFSVRTIDGSTAYTRNGNFYMSVVDDGTYMLANSDGLAVLDTEGNPIYFDEGVTSADVTVSADGEICVPDSSGNAQGTGVKIGLTQFSNPSGLLKLSGTLYKESAASGVPLNEETNTSITKSTVKQGYLEMSNVQVADEMVNLIVAQRAYELNSKAITTSDEMMQTANNLKN
jgi:flagellar basal-body rod protein FlgG